MPAYRFESASAAGRIERGQRCLVERPDLMSAGTSRAACWLHDRGGVGAPVAKELVDA